MKFGIILRNQISQQFPLLTMSNLNLNNLTNNTNSTNQTRSEPRTARTYIENQLDLQENNNTNLNLINNDNIEDNLENELDSDSNDFDINSEVHSFSPLPACDPGLGLHCPYHKFFSGS